MNKTEILKRVESLEAEVSDLKEKLKECDELERKIGRKYYTIYIAPNNGVVNSGFVIDENDYADNSRYSHNNYFMTKERAEQVVNKIKSLLRLERSHDIYCPDYEPNWENTNEVKSSIYFHEPTKKYCINNAYGAQYKTQVYFSSLEIAQKVCDILNEEVKNNER